MGAIEQCENINRIPNYNVLNTKDFPASVASFIFFREYVNSPKKAGSDSTYSRKLYSLMLGKSFYRSIHYSLGFLILITTLMTRRGREVVTFRIS